jgi:hypothetical protein
MKALNYLIYLKYLIITTLSIGIISEASAARVVTAVKPERVAKIFELSLMADVLDKKFEQKIDTNTRRTFHLSIELPAGLIPAIKNGSYVKVTLPTVHQNVAIAQITSFSKNHVELILANQVQQLEGQKLKVDLPFLPANLFKIPFQAIYSPRGEAAEVFVLSSDMKVQLVQIVPLQISSDGNIIVSSEQLKDALVVVQGTDNLLSGDTVQVNKESGAML